MMTLSMPFSFYTTDIHIDVKKQGVVCKQAESLSYLGINNTNRDIVMVFPSGAQFIYRAGQNVLDPNRDHPHAGYGEDIITYDGNPRDYGDTFTVVENFSNAPARVFENKYRPASASLSLEAAHSEVEKQFRNNNTMYSPSILHTLTLDDLRDSPTGVFIPHLGITVGLSNGRTENKYLNQIYGDAAKLSMSTLSIEVRGCHNRIGDLYAVQANDLIVPIRPEDTPDVVDSVKVSILDEKGRIVVIAEGTVEEALSNGLRMDYPGNQDKYFRLFRTKTDAENFTNHHVETIRREYEKQIDDLKRRQRDADTKRYKAESSFWAKVVNAVGTFFSGLTVIKTILGFFKQAEGIV